MKQTLKESLYHVHPSMDSDQHIHPLEIDDTLYKIQAKTAEEAAVMMARSFYVPTNNVCIYRFWIYGESWTLITVKVSIQYEVQTELNV